MRYPIYKQDNHYSCGAYCILMILKYFHANEEIKVIKEKCRITPSGISVYGMIACLKEYRIEAKAYTCTIDDIIQQVKLPCILHVVKNELTHYVVLYKIHKGIAILGDPEDGLCKIPVSKLEELFSGVCISILHVGRIPKSTSYHPFIQFIYQHIKQHYHQVFKISGYSFLVAILSLIGSLYFQIIIDSIQTMDIVTIVLVSLFFAFIMAMKILVSYLRKMYTLTLQKEMDTHYVKQTLQNMMYLPLRYFSLNQEGILLNKVQDLYRLSEFFIKVYNTLFVDSVFVFAIFTGLFMMNKRVAFILGVCLAIITAGCYQLLIKLTSMNKEVIIRYDAMQQTILEYISNMFMIHQYHQRRFMKDKLAYYFQGYLQPYLHREEIFTKFQSSIEGVLQAILFIVVLLACYLFKQGDISVGDILVFYMLTSYLIDPLMNIVLVTIEREEVKIIFERYKDILPERKKKKKKIHRINSITLHDVSYSYGYSLPILEHLDLTINTSIYLQGDNGSGKTTLLHLLMGYDKVSHGEICINGMNINEIDLSSLYHRMYYIAKQSVFFHESLKFNILQGHIERENIMLELLHLFSVSELIPRLEEKIDKDGGFLSSGQQQIVMLIRAILCKPDVLILDEALANIDNRRVKKILLYLQTRLEKTIVILVNHQTNIVNVKYECVIIKDGKIENGE